MSDRAPLRLDAQERVNWVPRCSPPSLWRGALFAGCMLAAFGLFRYYATHPKAPLLRKVAVISGGASLSLMGALSLCVGYKQVREPDRGGRAPGLDAPGGPGNHVAKPSELKARILAGAEAIKESDISTYGYVLTNIGKLAQVEQMALFGPLTSAFGETYAFSFLTPFTVQHHTFNAGSSRCTGGQLATLWDKLKENEGALAQWARVTQIDLSKAVLNESDVEALISLIKAAPDLEDFRIEHVILPSKGDSMMVALLSSSNRCQLFLAGMTFADGDEDKLNKLLLEPNQRVSLSLAKLSASCRAILIEGLKKTPISILELDGLGFTEQELNQIGHKLRKRSDHSQSRSVLKVGLGKLTARELEAFCEGFFNLEEGFDWSRAKAGRKGFPVKGDPVSDDHNDQGSVQIAMNNQEPLSDYLHELINNLQVWKQGRLEPLFVYG